MFLSKKKFIIPVTGTMLPITYVQDETFSKEMMGPGFAIQPSRNTILSPCNGIVKMIFPTGHALGMQMKNGTEILLHIGLDTVELNGSGFQVHVKENEEIKAGQKLLDFDMSFIKEKGYDPIVIIVFPQGNTLHLPTLPCNVKEGESIRIF